MLHFNQELLHRAFKVQTQAYKPAATTNTTEELSLSFHQNVFSSCRNSIIVPVTKKQANCSRILPVIKINFPHPVTLFEHSFTMIRSVYVKYFQETPKSFFSQLRRFLEVRCLSLKSFSVSSSVRRNFYAF